MNRPTTRLPLSTANGSRSADSIRAERPRGSIMKYQMLNRFASFGRTAMRMSVAAGCCCALMITSNSVTSAQSFSSGEGLASPAELSHGDQSYRVVQADQFQTAADVGTASSPSFSAASWPGSTGCSSCGTGCGGSCGGYSAACGPCGGGGRVRCGGGYSPYSNYGNPCAPCEPFCYVLGEALYMERDGKETFTLSPNYNLGGFEHEWASRITIGSVPNCVDGYEVGFTGFFEWDMAGTLAAPGAGILTTLTAGPPLVATDLSAFNDTVVASGQLYEAEYWSFEANRTMMGWDFAKLLYGVRYAQYDEQFFYATRNNANEVGFLASTTDNDLIGIQGGLDLLYPVSRHAFADFRSRIGGFLNLVDTSFGVSNDGTVLVANTDSEEDFAAIIEIGGGIRYQVGQMLAVRAGAEAWYFTGIAAANNQFGNVITPSSGRGVRNGDDFLVTGVSVGAELRY